MRMSAPFLILASIVGATIIGWVLVLGHRQKWILFLKILCREMCRRNTCTEPLDNRRPFIPEGRYRVRQSFSTSSGPFYEDEILTYKRQAYSHYDGITFFMFEDSSGRVRSWEVSDREATDERESLVEEL